MRRGFWFGAGMAAGAYGVVRARRVMEAFTPDGIRDRLSGLGVGVRVFNEEMRAGMTEKETELRDRIALMRDGGAPELTSSEGAAPRSLSGSAPTERETT